MKKYKESENHQKSNDKDIAKCSCSNRAISNGNVAVSRVRNTPVFLMEWRSNLFTIHVPYSVVSSRYESSPSVIIPS